MLNGANQRERLAMEEPGYRHLASGANNIATPPVREGTSLAETSQSATPQQQDQPVEKLIWHCLWNPDGD